MLSFVIDIVPNVCIRIHSIFKSFATLFSYKAFSNEGILMCFRRLLMRENGLSRFHEDIGKRQTYGASIVKP